MRAARRLLAEGRAAAGRAEEDHRIVVYLLTARGADAVERVRADVLAEGAGGDPDAAVAGDAETVARAVRELAGAGADAVILQPTADEPDPEGFVRFAAEEVRPLVP